MGTNITQERQQAHALLDLLPQEKPRHRSFASGGQRSLARSLANAPIDDARPFGLFIGGSDNQNTMKKASRGSWELIRAAVS